MTVAYRKSFYRSLKGQAADSAREILPFILEHIKPQSVVDVGCGSGDWLNVCTELGISDICGIDFHAGKVLNIPGSEYVTLDLTKPFDVPRKYDLAMSFEVGEHLPEESAEGFVRSITNLAPVVLFSAAIPQQGGTNHVNEQWPSYWANQFQKFGFEPIDCVRRTFWENPTVTCYYAQNIVLYASKGAPRYEQLRSLPTFSMLPVVHPGMFHGAATELHALRPLYTARGLVKRLPGALWNSVSDRTRRLLDR
jgi:SAM-dependent methyltransferase